MRGVIAFVALAVAVGACGGDDGEAASDWVDVETDGFVYSVTALGDGFIASEDVDGATRVIVSDDGLTWDAVETDVVASGESLHWMDGGPAGAVGEVFEDGPPQVVTTTDGAMFTRADPLAVLEFGEVGIPGMAWGPAGPMVAISRGGEPIGLIASADGTTWASIELPDGVGDFVNPDTSPIAATQWGYLVVGVPDLVDGNDNPGVHAWSSTDGTGWALEEISPDFISGFWPPVAWRDGYVIGGSTFTPVDEIGEEGTWETLMWRSTGDGVWSIVDTTDYDGPNEVILVDGSDLGVFAVAWTDDSFSRLDALFSRDLETWQVWTDDQAFGTRNAMTVDWGDAAVGSSAVVVPVDGDLRVFQPDAETG
jgi:hypothetical protein